MPPRENMLPNVYVTPKLVGSVASFGKLMTQRKVKKAPIPKQKTLPIIL
jgi:hypothetical protein